MLDSAYVRTLLPRVKTKLTLSVSAKSIRRAKSVARRRGVPLSRLVEEHFDRLAPAGGKHDSAEAHSELDPRLSSMGESGRELAHLLARRRTP